MNKSISILTSLIAIHTLGAADFESTGTEAVVVPDGAYDSIRSLDSSTLTMNDGTTANTGAVSRDSSTFVMNGGIVNFEGVIATEQSTFTINGGTINGSIVTYLSGRVEMNGGSASGNVVSTYNDSFFDMNSGEVNTIQTFDSSSLEYRGGTVSNNILASEASDIIIYANSFGESYVGGETLGLSDFGNDPLVDPFTNGETFSLRLEDGSNVSLTFRANNETTLREWTGTLNLVSVPLIPELSYSAFALGISSFAASFLRRERSKKAE